MLVRTRKEAIKLNLSVYYPDRPCKRGHSVGYSVHGGCIECARYRAAAHHLANRDSNNKKMRENYRADPERIKARSQKWRKDNPEKVKLQHQNWQRKNPQKKSVKKKSVKKNQNRFYQLRRRRNDLNYRIAGNLRTRLCNAVKRGSKGGSAVRDLGCSIQELKVYLEAKFTPGMSWMNWGLYTWHIDHIKPLSSFDLTDRKQFLEAVNYTNLQPLWSTDNLTKSNLT